MPKFLANENIPAKAIETARKAGQDVSWITEIDPGATDESVVHRSVSEDRVLVTFDKDFGEMAFRLGHKSTCGVILLRPRLRSPDYVAQFMTAVLSQPIDWRGHFSVAQEKRIRVVPLP